MYSGDQIQPKYMDHPSVLIAAAGQRWRARIDVPLYLVPRVRPTTRYSTRRGTEQVEGRAERQLDHLACASCPPDQYIMFITMSKRYCYCFCSLHAGIKFHDHLRYTRFCTIQYDSTLDLSESINSQRRSPLST